MEAKAGPVSSGDLLASLGTARMPVLIDVRRAPAFAAAETLIVGAIRRLPEDVERWKAALPHDRAITAYCIHGQEVSQGVAQALCAAGYDASYLEDGITGWTERGLPTRRKRSPEPGKWITRERPKIDRIACPWLIRRFVDPEAEFLYVPAADVLAAAARCGAIPYDIPGAEFGHRGDECSFDAFLRLYGIGDPALDRLALIVRGADTGRLDLAPQSSGLLAVSHGLSMSFADDHEMLERGMVVYDALYAWCRAQAG